jgi:hypothetical protein
METTQTLELVFDLPLYKDNISVKEYDDATNSFKPCYKTISITDQNNFFKDMDDFKKYLIEVENIKYETKYGYEKLKRLVKEYKEKIKENRTLCCWYVNYVEDNEQYIEEMPTDALKEKYRNKLAVLNKHDFQRVKKCDRFVKTHINEIVEFMNSYGILNDEKNKTKKSAWNKAYYEKKKEEKGIQDRKLLTEEERENYQKEYYLKKKEEKGIQDRKILTEEERENYQKEYYLKKKEEKGIKSRKILTEEERKEYQRNYYLKKKAEKEKLINNPV